MPADYYQYLVSGGTGLTSHTPDTRITNVNTLPAGPFQLTNGNLFTYNAYAASPVHRFYQMWQQLDCDRSHITSATPSGCNAKLFSWVEVTVGAGTNGLAQPANFDINYLPGATTTGEGSTALGFYNVQQGDAPYFKYLADTYSMSDNFHQSVQWRHRCQPHHARPRRCHLLHRRRRPCEGTTSQRDGGSRHSQRWCGRRS